MSKRTHTINNLIHSLTFTVFLTIACSVAEQRNACPCWVGLDFSKILQQEHSGKTLDVVIYGQDGSAAYSHSYGLDSCASYYEVEMPRGRYTVSALMGDISVGPDRQADTLLGKSLPLDASGESAEAVIEAFKQFATIGIKLLSSPYDSLSITLKAASAAIDRRSLEGLPQQYSCSGNFSEGTAGFNILRQAEGEILLSFSDAASGRHITDIDLGEWLREIGYDFSAENLADIVLILDFHSGRATLSIAGWLDAPAYFVIF